MAVKGSGSLPRHSFALAPSFVRASTVPRHPVHSDVPLAMVSCVSWHNVLHGINLRLRCQGDEAWFAFRFAGGAAETAL